MKLDDAQVLTEVEGLIEEFRWARAEPLTREHRTYHALKEVASVLRSRRPAAMGEARKALQGRLAHVQRHPQGHGGARVGALLALAEETMGRWPVIRLALETFEKGRTT